MIGIPRVGRPGPSRGFTLIELLVVIVFGALVIENVFRLVVTQQRSYAQQRQVVDLRSNLRLATSLLVTELRGIAPEDLYAIGSNSITLRSTIGAATICTESPAGATGDPEYVLWRESGEFLATAADTALVYSAGGGSIGDESWKRLRVLTATVAGNNPPACDWGNGAAGGYTISVSGDTAGITVGAQVKAFRRTEYGLYQDSGRWWLGRRVSGATTWEELTGPFKAPADSGLVLRYFDAAGAVTTNPADVASVEVLFTGETEQAAWRTAGGGKRNVHTESLRTRVALRG